MLQQAVPPSNPIVASSVTWSMAAVFCSNLGCNSSMQLQRVVQTPWTLPFHCPRRQRACSN
jgi:hypothetical protein